MSPTTLKKLTKSRDLGFLFERRNKKPWYFKLWYWGVRPKLNTVKSEIMSWPFRIKNGFDYRDTCSLDCSIAKYIIPRLKHLKKHKFGYPCGLTDKKWSKILDKILFALEKIADNNYFYDKKTDKKIAEGLELLGKYFRNLWY